MTEQTPHPAGWWQASDGRWDPPAPHPERQPTPTIPLLAAPSMPSPAHVSVTTSVNARSDFRAPSAASVATSTVGNIVWLVFAGWWLAVAYVFAGLINMITIIGIPFGIQSFKLAGYALWPFGRVVVQRPGRDVGLSLLGNVIWFIFGGFWLAMAHLFAALLLGLTIMGIPLALASLKMAGLALAPFGKQIMSRRELASSPNVVVVVSVG